jgi:serine O-acetyltransferase
MIRSDIPLKKLISDTVKALSALRSSSACASSPLCSPPDRREVVRVIKALQALLFPSCFQRENPRMSDEALLECTARDLTEQIGRAFLFRGGEGDAAALCDRYLARLPGIKRLLLLDVEALYEGDPAARSREEVMICYPGFYAISIYRLAHELYALEVPLLPRIMTEFAHEKTGIDIHPGAAIGEYFFIDHGTGTVIGETTVIGDHVKLYQGVTLGARSFDLDENGNPVKGIKRHPNIGNNVVIYANATILGGDTSIGDNCVIGGNTWLTSSVPAGEIVQYHSPDQEDRES